MATRPRDSVVEVHYFNFKRKQNNGQLISCSQHKIRDEIKFDSFELYITKLNKDAKKASQLLSMFLDTLLVKPMTNLD